jgi:hypothetical protein
MLISEQNNGRLSIPMQRANHGKLHKLQLSFLSFSVKRGCLLGRTLYNTTNNNNNNNNMFHAACRSVWSIGDPFNGSCCSLAVLAGRSGRQEYQGASFARPLSMMAACLTDIGFLISIHPVMLSCFVSMFRERTLIGRIVVAQTISTCIASNLRHPAAVSLPRHLIAQCFAYAICAIIVCSVHDFGTSELQTTSYTISATFMHVRYKGISISVGEDRHVLVLYSFGLSRCLSPRKAICTLLFCLRSVVMLC